MLNYFCRNSDKNMYIFIYIVFLFFLAYDATSEVIFCMDDQAEMSLSSDNNAESDMSLSPTGSQTEGTLMTVEENYAAIATLRQVRLYTISARRYFVTQRRLVDLNLRYVNLGRLRRLRLIDQRHRLTTDIDSMNRQVRSIDRNIRQIYRNNLGIR